MPTRRMHDTSTLGADLQHLLDAQRDERIFVELAAAIAEEIAGTAAHAIEQAARPDRLRFGIYVPDDHDVRTGLHRYRDDPRFSIEFSSSSAPSDRQWARHRAQSFYDGEPYVLQIDGGARFASGWDAAYIELLAAADTERPILTDAPLVVRCLDLPDPTRTTTGLEMLARHRFTIGRFCLDVPHDPAPHGNDDLRLAVRAYTHGYDASRPAVALVTTEDTERRADHVDQHLIARIGRELSRTPVGVDHGLGTSRTVAALLGLVTTT